MARWPKLGDPRMTYAVIVRRQHPEMLSPGEPLEHALIFTEREGLEHLRPELGEYTVEFNLGVFGHPSTWRRLDKRTTAGRAVLAASAAYMEAGRVAAACAGKLLACPTDALRAERERLIAAYHATGQAYVDAARLLPITPHPYLPIVAPSVGAAAS